LLSAVRFGVAFKMLLINQLEFHRMTALWSCCLFFLDEICIACAFENMKKHEIVA
jgi:hypothetical protein